MELKNFFAALKPLAALLFLIIGARILGIGIVDIIRFSIYGVILIFYFMICSALWLAAFKNDVGRTGYYTVALLTLPFFIVVKISTRLNLLSKAVYTVNSFAKSKGFADVDTLAYSIGIEESLDE